MTPTAWEMIGSSKLPSSFKPEASISRSIANLKSLRSGSLGIKSPSTLAGILGILKGRSNSPPPASAKGPSPTTFTPSAPIPSAPKPKIGSARSSPTESPPPWAPSTNLTSALPQTSVSSSADCFQVSPLPNPPTNLKLPSPGWSPSWVTRSIALFHAIFTKTWMPPRTQNRPISPGFVCEKPACSPTLAPSQRPASPSTCSLKIFRKIKLSWRAAATSTAISTREKMPLNSMRRNWTCWVKKRVPIAFACS